MDSQQSRKQWYKTEDGIVHKQGVGLWLLWETWDYLCMIPVIIKRKTTEGRLYLKYLLTAAIFSNV